MGNTQGGDAAAAGDAAAGTTGEPGRGHRRVIPVQLNVVQLATASDGFANSAPIPFPFTIKGAMIYSSAASQLIFVELGWAASTVDSLAKVGQSQQILLPFGPTSSSVVSTRTCILMLTTAMTIEPINIRVDEPNNRLWMHMWNNQGVAQSTVAIVFVEVDPPD